MGLLVDGLGLTGEGRLAQTQLRHLQQPGIGRHSIAGLEPNHITGHQLFTRQPLPFAIAAQGDQRLGHLAQGQQGLLSLAFLEVAKQGIEPDDQHDRDRILGELLLHPGHPSRHGRHGQQHDQHHVAELIPEDPQLAAPGLEFEAVESQLSQALSGAGGAQTINTALQAVQALLGRQRMPGRRGVGGAHLDH